MTSSSRTAVALALAAVACSSSRTTLSAGVAAPTAIVAFNGVTSRYAPTAEVLVRPYIAVAAGAGSELRIIDPTEDRPILGETLIFPLSIPTSPRPLFLAAASLGDGKADLLAVASPSTATGPTLEIVTTWEAANRIETTVPIPGPDATSQIVSLTAGPIPGRTGQARLVVGLATPAGGRLAVVDVARGPNGEVVVGTPDGTGAIVPGAPVVAPLLAAGAPYDPLDLAFSPDGTKLFVATTDPLGTVQETVGAQVQSFELRGVAQLDVGATADASTWTFTALDARDGTTKVATALVVEKLLQTSPGVPAGRDDFPAAGTAPQLLVYAALDPAGCGETRPIRCGVATLVPGVGLATDPTRVIATGLDATNTTEGMPYRAPLEPALGVPTALATSGPPASPAGGTACVDQPVARARLAALGQSCTTALALIASSDGNSYVADLGRFEIPSVQSVIGDANTHTRASAAAPTLPAGVNGARIGLTNASGQTFDATELPSRVQVSPGYTPIQTFVVTWQGVLPALDQVPGVVIRTADGVLLASQAESPGSALGWLGGVRLDSKSLGVHDTAAAALLQDEREDIAQILTADPGPCDTADARVAVESPVLVVNAPDLAAAVPTPAGSLRIDPTLCYASGLEVGQTRKVFFNIRSGGLLLTGTPDTGLGYLGRPKFGQLYQLRYDSTKDVPEHAAEPQSEEQLLARKARRRFYPTGADGCGGANNCSGYLLNYNLDEGPTIAFTPVHEGAADVRPPRDATLTIVTDSGYRPFLSRPNGAVLPVAATKVDRSAPPLSQGLEIRWYIAYSNDEVFVFGPAEAANQPFSIR